MKAKDLKNIADFLSDNRGEFIRLLCTASTYKSVEDELNRTIKALHGAEAELQEIRNTLHLSRVAVYQPSNILLYSYALYALIPSLFCVRIFIRPSYLTKDIVSHLHRNLMQEFSLPIELVLKSHRQFFNQIVLQSQMVIFTGRYKNALEIRSKLNPHQLFLFFGSGINPLIIGTEADINKAVDDSIAARVFNSGQDCLCPNVIFVHEDIAEIYLKTLKQKVQKLQIGQRSNPKTDVAPLYYKDVIPEVKKYLETHSQSIIYGGNINEEKQIVYPTILLSSVNDAWDMMEFFSPVFNVVIYSSINDLEAALNSSPLNEHRMGASIYGIDEPPHFLQENHVIAMNQTLFDIEDGNQPFGGYGERASHVFFKGEIQCRPLLISKEILKAFGD
jgi:aldehyde dehydrogenase (NAD+)/succinate-semialdehyde dehydrogenase/glutarate-semialdehyde dehydrogenase